MELLLLGIGVVRLFLYSLLLSTAQESINKLARPPVDVRYLPDTLLCISSEMMMLKEQLYKLAVSKSVWQEVGNIVSTVNKYISTDFAVCASTN